MADSAGHLEAFRRETREPGSNPTARPPCARPCPRTKSSGAASNAKFREPGVQALAGARWARKGWTAPIWPEGVRRRRD